MRNFFKEYLLFIFYSVVSIAVIGIFFYTLAPTNLEEGVVASILNESNLNQSMIDEAVNQGQGDTSNEFGYFEKIDEINVYFNVLGQVLPYGVDYQWEDYIKYKDDNEPNSYLNADGTENKDNEHCLALVKYHNVITGATTTEEIDLTNFVTPANYTNEHPIPLFDYLNETPREYEATIEIVPYILNWENIHVKKNVAYFIMPKTALLTFTGRAKMPNGNYFVNKRIVFYKGEQQMALTQTDANGNFLIGVNTPEEDGGKNTEDLMPIGEYKFVIDAEGVDYSITFPEDKFDVEEGDSTTINLGIITFAEGD